MLLFMSSNTGFFNRKKILITGGAGFIGSHLVSRLIAAGAQTHIVDNLFSGYERYVLRVWDENGIKYKKTSTGYEAEGGNKFTRLDVLDYDALVRVMKGNQIVFHLAALFGGRGFIDTHPADCCENFAMNQNVFKAAHVTGIERVQFASSACVYPGDLQKDYGSDYLLKEDDAFSRNWGNADREYGWAKLMGELSLKAYRQQYGLNSSITRYVTAYGPWENDTHAIIALIKRAIDHEDPYLVWGTGKQDRDFTYVDDIVSGTMLACQKVTDATAINLGTGKRYTIRDVVNSIFDSIGWHPRNIIFDPTKPEGVKTRALDNSMAYKLLGWKPEYDLAQGLKKTIEWYLKTRPKSVETII